jgi:hypothetical protein
MNIRIAIIFIFLTTAICTACGAQSIDIGLSSPEATTKSFMRSMDKGKPDVALDQICESFAIPKLPEGFLKDDRYSTISNDNEYAIVNVKGEIRIDEDFGSAKKMLDFDLKLYNKDGKWCILRDSMVNLVNSLGDLTY